MEEIYETLKHYKLTANQYDFSRNYLGQCKSYYSVCKAQQKIPSKATLIKLAMNLEEQVGQIQNNRSYGYSKSLQGLAFTLEEMAQAVWNEVKTIN
jgi:hypothetical protein